MRTTYKCIYSYYETLLGIWSQWNESILYGGFSDNAQNLTEALNINTSDGRSRAKEMYRIGLLKKELTNGRSGLDYIQAGNNIQSGLGFISALIEKAIRMANGRSQSIDKALGALCAIYAIVQSVKIDNVEVSINTLIYRLNQIFPCPENLDFRKWHRYVLSAFFCETKYREDIHNGIINEQLQDSVYFTEFLKRKRQNLQLTIRSNKKNGYASRFTISSSNDVMNAIEERISLTNIIQQKSPLFIFGQDGEDTPTGFYGMAHKYFSKFLKLCSEAEIEKIEDNPFLPLYDEDSEDSPKSSLLTYLPTIFNQQSVELQNEFNELMKSIYEGAIDALGILEYSQQKSNSSSIGTNIYQRYLTAIRTKPFILLAGISGTGKSQIVRKLAQATIPLDNDNEGTRWENPRPRNFELIQVKPNWHNSMDVVGYKSNIGKDGEHYEFTPFVEFVAKAWQEPETPYFLCLDEMNLAPVEEYFAEFLSAIESRTVDAEGNYWTDPIIKPFDDFGDELCNAMLERLLGQSTRKDRKRELEEQFKQKGLTLPPNLIVMGTVNMDETTFSFSRKVLDRAMSIEMNEVNFSSFLDGTSEQVFPNLTEQNRLFVDRPIKAKEVKYYLGESAEIIIKYLTDINTLLEGTPFKLGYRSANEAMLYVKSAHDFGNTNTARALDEFTLMKILSRIEGDETKLTIENSDLRLQKLVLESPSQDQYGQITVLSVLKAIIKTHLGTEQLASIKKLDEMINTLHREHFVSYWV